jgi:hypothetical protein
MWKSIDIAIVKGQCSLMRKGVHVSASNSFHKIMGSGCNPKGLTDQTQLLPRQRKVPNL